MDNEILGDASTTPQTSGEVVQPADESKTYVTVAEFKSQQKIINALQAQLRRNGQQTNPTQKPDATTDLGQMSEVAQLRRELKQKEIEAETYVKNTAMSKAFSGHGLDSDGEEAMQALLEKRYGSKIVVQHGEVYVVDPDNIDDVDDKGEPIPQKLSDFVSAFVAKRGDKFRAPIETPAKQIRGVQASQKVVPYSAMSPQERSKLSGYEKTAMIVKELKIGKK